MNNPPAGAWISQIEGARSTAELVRMLRDYLASMSVEDSAHLPRALSAETIERASDIQEWAVALAQADLKATGSEASTGVLHEAAVVFGAAGSRIPKVQE